MNRPREVQAKKEDDPKLLKIPNSSRHWSNFKNPRIVRVSRTFGGKDRHSKVCTVRGLRDRRIRLSVPTAIQLYELQDRLGLSQPSKVVDWLLDATKNDIDNLPPLPMLPIHPSVLPNPHESSHLLAPTYAKELGIGATKEVIGKDLSHEGLGGLVTQISAQNLFPLNNNTQPNSFPNFPYNFHWDPPNLSLSQSGYNYNTNNAAFPDDHDHRSCHAGAFLPPNSDLYFCPSAAAMPSFLPNFSSMDQNDQFRQINQQINNSVLLPTTLNLISSPVKAFLNNSKPSVYSSQESDARRLVKDNSSSKS